MVNLLVPLLFPLLLTSRAVGSSIASSDSLPFQVTSATPDGDPGHIPPTFPILPFAKYRLNPILSANPANDWEAAYVYNPTAIVLNGTVFLLYRAQNAGKTSSMGLAWSTDGYHFTRLTHPILTATEPWEQGGGTEDPRLVRVNGTFYLTYTAFDTSAATARLCLATSDDLVHWTKFPPLFPDFADVAVRGSTVRAARVNWTKSAAIVAEPTADGLYHMYFGDSVFHHATSRDLLNWSVAPATFAAPVHAWELGLIEPGPAPVRTRDGRWLLVYNGMALGDDVYRATQYSVGQMLLDPRPTVTLALPGDGLRPSGGRDTAVQVHVAESGSGSGNGNGSATRPHDPPPANARPVARLEVPFLTPTTDEEEKGQVDLVVFAEGLVQFQGRWFLYYGQADRTVGVAVAEVQPW